MEKKLIDLNRQFNVLILTSSKNQKHLIEVNQRLRDELKNKEMQLQKALQENKVLKENQKKYKNKLEIIKERIQHDIEESEFIKERDKQKVIDKGFIDKIKENMDEYVNVLNEMVLRMAINKNPHHQYLFFQFVLHMK